MKFLGRKAKLPAYSEPNSRGTFQIDNVGSLRMCLTNMTGPFFATSPYDRTKFLNTTIDGKQDSVGNFDLSRTSAIYQDSVSTVQVASLLGLWLLKAY